MDFFSMFFERFKTFLSRFIALFSFAQDGYFADTEESEVDSGFIIFDNKPHKK